jgi:hypothetical protein
MMSDILVELEELHERVSNPKYTHPTRFTHTERDLLLKITQEVIKLIRRNRPIGKGSPYDASRGGFKALGKK